MAMSTPDALLELFEGLGIEYIFCTPGSEWVPVFEALAGRTGRKKKLKYINCRHEMLAVSMASGYAQATGCLPAVLLHVGVGPLHAAMAIRSAYRGQVPMLIGTGYALDYNEPGSWHSLSRLSDMGGPDALVKPYVKWSNTVTSATILLDSVCRGAQIALTVPRGPVMLSIPQELIGATVDKVNKASAPPVPVLPEPRPPEVSRVARQLIEARQPIIITEQAGRSPGAIPALVELAELLASPVFEGIDPIMANFPSHHPLHLGYDVTDGLKVADVVFVVGGTTPWSPPASFPGKGVTAILLDEDILKERLGYWGYRFDMKISADIGRWLQALTAEVRRLLNSTGKSEAAYRERYQRWQAEHERLMAKSKTEALSERENRPISHKWFLHRASEILPDNAIRLDEAVTLGLSVRRYLAKPGGYYRVSRGGLGTGLGIAAGMKLAHPERPVVLFIGDGSFNFNPVLAGLGVCQEYRLPFLTVILNNGGYMAMKHGLVRSYPQGSSLSQNRYFGVDIKPAPDYAKIAEAFDAHGARVAEPGDIEPALTGALKALASGRAALLDVVLEPD